VTLLIVDASVAAKWFVEEENSTAALSVLSEGNRLHAPDFFLLEVDSIFWKWIRRGVITLTEAESLRKTLHRYPVTLHPLAPLIEPAFAIANRTGSTVYDSIYVALAVLLEGKMVTADRKLCDSLGNSPFAEHIAWVGDICSQK